MNTKRVVGWTGFFAVAAALTWGAGYLQPAEESDDQIGRAHV